MRWIIRRIVLSLIFALLAFAGEAKKATTEIDSIAKTVEAAGLNNDNFNMYINLANQNKYIQFDKALIYTKMAAYLAGKLKDSLLIGKSSKTIGDLFMSIDLAESARKYYEYNLKAQRKAADKFGIAEALNDLAEVELNKQNFAKAEVFLGEAYETLKIVKTKNETDKDALAYRINNNFLLMAINRNQLETARKYMKNSQKLALKYPNLVEEKFKLLLYSAKFSLLLLQKDKAIQQLEKARNIADSTGNTQALIAYYNMIAVSFAFAENTEKQVYNLKNGLQLAQQSQNFGQGANLAYTIAAVYENEKMADSALKYLTQAYELTTSLNQSKFEVDLMLLDFETKFKELVVKNKLKQKSQLLIAIGFLVLLLVILTIVGFRFLVLKKKRKTQQMLAANHELNIDKANLEKEKVEQEVQVNNKTFVTNLIYQIRKHELIKEGIKELGEHRKQLGIKNFRILSTIISEISDPQDEKLTDDFLQAFKSINPDLFDKLDKVSTELTKNERLLSAYLYLGLNTKEIAFISQKNPRSIEVARTRLRKKLNLTDPNQQFVDFFNSL